MGPEIGETIAALSRAKARPDVVVMPDFFLDRIVTFLGSTEELVEGISRVAKQGGGNILGTEQSIIRGGNAANTASALASLGARAHLIARTSPLGLQLLRQFLGKKVDLSPVKADGRLALTVALEVLHRGRRVNVMLSDPGSVADFRFGDLTGRDLKLIRAADFICVFNWNQNRYGTELARGVFTHAMARGKGRKFFDAGDPSPKKDEIGVLMKELKRGIVDILSLNENEAFWFASHFDESIRRKRGRMKPEDLARDCARVLYDELGAIVDLHTASYSLSIVDGREHSAPAFEAEVRRATGAGDAWNAADIFAHAAGLPHEHRLRFANAYAAHYISGLSGLHPTKGEIIRFLKECQRREFGSKSRLRAPGGI